METRVPCTMLCTVRVKREGAGEGTQPTNEGGREQAGEKREKRVPRTMLCTVRVGERADREGPRGTRHTKGKRHEKGATEGTGTKGERAAQRVVYLACSDSALSRRILGVARAGRRGRTQVGQETKSWGKDATAASPIRCPTYGGAACRAVQAAGQASESDEEDVSSPWTGVVQGVLHTDVHRVQKGAEQRE